MRLTKPDNTARYRRSLMRLMPRGFAWPKRQGSGQGAWLEANAQTLNEFEGYTYRVIEQWWPHQTCTRVPEWAAATGLPDNCFPDCDEISLRTQMLARLRGVTNLPYDDSSPAAPEVIAAYAREIGYEIEVWYNTPFRVGRNRVGDRLGLLNGILRVRVVRVCEPFRVGTHRVGRRLVECTQTSEDLLCLLKRIVSSRFQIDMIFD